MKKKTLVIAGAILITVVLGAVLFFVLQDGEKQSEETISLKGTWLVFQHGDDKPRNDYMVFSDNNVSYYRDGDTTPAATSTYSIKDNNLSTPDIEKSFTIQVISDNHVMLTETNTVVWRLLLVGESDADTTKIIPESIEGVYDVKAVDEGKRYNETMTFTDSHLSFVQDGTETISSDYTLSDDGILCLTTINREYNVYMNGNNLFFITAGDITVWELYKTK